MAKVLVACEWSGTVRDMFRAAGHDAISVDLLPGTQPLVHYQGDVRDIIDAGWDLMIATPPCTYLALSGVRWLTQGSERWQAMREATDLFNLLLSADIPHVCVENPKPHSYATELITQKHTQVIQPWEHGHPEKKQTYLWLKDLLPLKPSGDVSDMLEGLPYSKTHRVLYARGGKGKGKVRGKTYPGIALAMAHQWGPLL